MKLWQRLGRTAVVAGAACVILAQASGAHAAPAQKYRVVTLTGTTVTNGVATVSGTYSCAGGRGTTTTLEITIEQFSDVGGVTKLGASAPLTKPCPAKKQAWSVDLSALVLGQFEPFLDNRTINAQARMRYSGFTTTTGQLQFDIDRLLVEPTAKFANGTYAITEHYQCPAGETRSLAGEVSQVVQGKTALNTYRATLQCNGAQQNYIFTIASGLNAAQFTAGAFLLRGHLSLPTGGAFSRVASITDAIVFAS